MNLFDAIEPQISEDLIEIWEEYKKEKRYNSFEHYINSLLEELSLWQREKKQDYFEAVGFADKKTSEYLKFRFKIYEKRSMCI